jgi:hypothetical protein
MTIVYIKIQKSKDKLHFVLFITLYLQINYKRKPNWSFSSEKKFFEIITRHEYKVKTFITRKFKKFVQVMALKLTYFNFHGLYFIVHVNFNN